MAPPLISLLTIITLATNPTPNKHSLKFDRMVNELTLPPAAVECIDSAKQRTLFRGVLAGTADPQIRNAFAIIYRDLAPIRVAGDLIFSQLASVANEASERVGDGTLMVTDEDSLVSSRMLFDYVDGDNSGWLDRDEILASKELMNLIRVDEEDGDTPQSIVDRFMVLADENGDGIVSFVEFANATAARSQLRSVDEALTTTMVSATAGEERNKKRGAFGLRRSPDERFDAMLKQCLDWEESLGCGPDDATPPVAVKDEECAVDVQIMQKEQDGGEEDGRLLQVLKGSLVGARCEPVVEALKMCYLEYSPLRLGGDIIFKLLTQVVKTQIPKEN